MGISRRGVLALGSAAMMARGAHAAPGKNFVTANNSGYDTLDPHVVFDIGRIGSRLTCMTAWCGGWITRRSCKCGWPRRSISPQMA